MPTPEPTERAGGRRAGRGRLSIRLRRRARRRGDRGFTLVDIVCAISLMGIVVIPMLNAVFTGVSSSATATEISEIVTVLQNAADRVNRAPVGCDYTVYVQAAAQSQGWDASRATAKYQYYVPGASAKVGDEGTWADGGCPNGVRTPGLIQLVTVTIVSDSGQMSRSIKVVKSDV